MHDDPNNESGVRTVFRGLAALAFVGAGILHFVRPALYERIVPPQLPWPHALVLISGVAEIVGGVGLLVPRLRRAAAIGLTALLVAVFPANVFMAMHPERFADLHLSPWILWARLPLQGMLIAWVWCVSRSSSAGPSVG